MKPDRTIYEVRGILRSPRGICAAAGTDTLNRTHTPEPPSGPGCPDLHPAPPTADDQCNIICRTKLPLGKLSAALLTVLLLQTSQS